MKVTLYYWNYLRAYRVMVLLTGLLLYGPSLLAQHTGRNVPVTGGPEQPDSRISSDVRKDTAVFKFAPKQDMFLANYKENATNIDLLSRSIRKYKSSIESGELNVHVWGFCSSYDSDKKNLATAKDRSNRVKSYFILNEGLKEEHFRTRNSSLRWRGMSDVTVVSYLCADENATASSDAGHEVVSGGSLPADDEQMSQTEPEAADTVAESQTVVGQTPVESHPESDKTPVPSQSDPAYYRWAIKSNIAYLLATVANIGGEYRFADHYSVDLSVIYSPYTVARAYRMRFLAFQPEFRYWLRPTTKGHFFGAHLNIGAFNISVDHKHRYQSPDGFYGMGVSYGYMLPFARHWAAEFAVGLGYVYTKYDTYYNIPNGVRFEKGTPYNYWGLTKVGISLVYRFGK